MTTTATDVRSSAAPESGSHSQPASDRMRQILAKSTTDMEFRQSLLTSPRQALAAFCGIHESELPAGNVAFVENKADVTFVLPNFVTADDALSDRELETVAGGSPMLLVAGVVWGVDAALAAYLIGRDG